VTHHTNKSGSYKTDPIPIITLMDEGNGAALLESREGKVEDQGEGMSMALFCNLYNCTQLPGQPSVPFRH
jgi:hypothetical protein